jgi:hypothetical protein
VLIAFSDGDPNGNGDTTDEFPFDSSMGWPVSSRDAAGSTVLSVGGLFQDGYFAEDGMVNAPTPTPL